MKLSSFVGLVGERSFSRKCKKNNWHPIEQGWYRQKNDEMFFSPLNHNMLLIFLAFCSFFLKLNFILSDMSELNGGGWHCTTTTAIIIRMSLWLRRKTLSDVLVGGWYAIFFPTAPLPLFPLLSSPESFALALKLKINTLKVTIIERSLIDVWIFFHRIILKTGAIGGERSFKYVVVYELCVVSVKEQQT